VTGPSSPGQTPQDPEAAAADAAAAFMAMLRRVHELSGLTAGQIAAVSGLPRSTAYRFIDRSNRSLPKNRNQLHAFLRACRLPTESMIKLLSLWDELTGQPAGSSGADPATEIEGWEEGDLVAPPLAVSKQIWNGFHDEPERKPAIEGVVDIGYLDVDLSAVTDYISRSRKPPTRSNLPSGRCRDCQNVSSVHAPARPRRRSLAAVQAAVTRAFPLILLIIALYPMAVTVRFGHLFTNQTASILAASAITVGLLFGTSKWVHKPYWPDLITPGRLSAATATGIGVGVLAWLAVPQPLVGVLTGFIVFTATPLWIGLTERANIASTRGVFVVITSIWCGTVLGFVTALAEFPLLGSILAGILGAAMAAMMLSHNLLEQQN
jgi:hypothetical protein